MPKLLGSLFFGVLLTIAALSAPSPAWSNLRDEVRQFHVFLQNHPKVSTELRNNPNLVNNKKYLDKHDDLAKFLKRHPLGKERNRASSQPSFWPFLPRPTQSSLSFLANLQSGLAVPSPFARCPQNHRSPELNSWRHSSRRPTNKQIQHAHV
jgi:hypothetical protein